MYYIAKTTATIHAAAVAIHDAVQRGTLAIAACTQSLHSKAKVAALVHNDTQYDKVEAKLCSAIGGLEAERLALKASFERGLARLDAKVLAAHDTFKQDVCAVEAKLDKINAL
jgi:hypothetical protein